MSIVSDPARCINGYLFVQHLAGGSRQTFDQAFPKQSDLKYNKLNSHI